jgi:tetratricopeptide (TPR) repeat protein
VLRLRRLFDLGEAQPALVALGLLSETDDGPVSNLAEASETREGVMHGASGRNHFQFPPEDPTLSFVPNTEEEREGRLAILSKALICLGDIARYRELYNESNGRRAGQEDGPARRGRNRRGGAADIPPRPRNYDKARQCYEQARLLVPYEGNPSHQLAILSSYQKDSFSSLIHYYRALCVSQPYDTAAENLGTVLTKALEMWRQRTRRDRDKNGTNDIQLPPRVRIEVFKERVVVLHALWRVGMEKGIEKYVPSSQRH